MVAQPRFDDEDIRKEKEIMLSQLRQGRQNPTWVASRLVRMLLYPKQHPLARPLSGYEATVERLEAHQVRDFYQAHFRPDVSTLILVGDVSPQEMLPVLEDAFGAWSSGERPLPSIAADVPPNNSSNAGRFFAVDVPGAVQSVLIVAKPWTHRRADHTVASEIANRIIGGDFLSRLNQNLREKHGYTYGARSGFAYYPDCGEWLARTSVRADVTAAALREMLNELEASVATRTLTDDEIHVARLAELHTFPESFETLHQLSESLADFIAHRLPLNYWQTFRDQLQRIQPDEVRRAARKLLGEGRLLILVVGDRATIEPQLRQAGWQEITWVDADGR
jgi:predicted Zn-dependent peptidase